MGVMGFFGHPAFLAVTAVIAIGIVAYEYYQAHKAQKTTSGRCRRSSGSTFVVYEPSNVKSWDAKSTENIESSATKTFQERSEGKEIRHRKQASELNREQNSDQHTSRLDRISQTKEINVNDSECEGGVTTPIKSSHDSSHSTVGDKDVNVFDFESRNHPDPYGVSIESKDEIQIESNKTLCAKLQDNPRNVIESKVCEQPVPEDSMLGVTTAKESDNCKADIAIQPMESSDQGNDSNKVTRNGPENSQTDMAFINNPILPVNQFDNCVSTSSESINSRNKLKENSSLMNTSNTKSDSLSESWKKVSNSEKTDDLCLCCDKDPITTIVLPCAHKYTCKECAPMLFQHYDKCPTCRNEVVSFQSI